MKTAQQPLRPPVSIQDLMTVTGLGRTAVKEAIVRGELPGSKVGGRYVVPADAFDAFCAGTWVARPRPVVHQPLPQPDRLIRRRATT